MNAENLRQSAHIPVASLGANGKLPAFFCQTDIVVKKVALLVKDAIPASDGAYLGLKLKNGPVVVASLDTRASNQGAVGASVGKQFLVPPDHAGPALCTGGSTLTLESDAGGSVSLTNALVQIEYVRDKNN